MVEGCDPGAEFGRFVDCTRLGRSVETHVIEADEGERKALSDRLDLVCLDGLNARVGLYRTSEGLIRLKARFGARYVQGCIVSLQPVHQELEEEFEVYFKEGTDPNGSGKLEVPIEDEFSPETLEQGGIDIGEVVSQQLALALDPYPRAPGVVFEPEIERYSEAAPVNSLADIGKLVSNGHREGT